MEDNPVSKIFESFPRQGAGDDDHTQKAFSMITEPPTGGGEILDVGCGKGVQTMALARLCPSCRIVATDIHQRYLDAVDEKIAAGGFSGRIKTVRASMDDLPFDEESFDILWAEGCASIIGIENAVRYWKKLLKQGGYMVISDIFWFTETPSDEAREFFAEFHPAMMIEEKGSEIIRNAGLEMVGSFRLPSRVWEESFYGNLREKFGELEEEYADDEGALMVIEGLKRQTRIFEKYPDEFGNTYYVMRKPL
ncbi:class I SAM-dependent methyltransferase [Methanoculleus sp. FWC-SCC1]|uniref:Class I SAM-dependent methyltransferase n=1 Tax=Methanoculleus frigidifontis TaxID=2584085 RepID=A0ABT8MB09_9EURY|nr:class I SAM-dependent methyltransferase [Methanoculleus sp. FWC-SCC1]MDN7025128.1 class I SAM-dependent methyltransferase [Methanoculleus sp. FWC-SCC1]